MDIEVAKDRLFQSKQSMELSDLVTGKPIEENVKLAIETINTVLNYIEELEKENTNAKYQYDLGYKACEIEFTNKIRDKIEELENLIKEAHKELGSASKEFTIYVSQEKILKELLEEEI